MLCVLFNPFSNRTIGLRHLAPTNTAVMVSLRKPIANSVCCFFPPWNPARCTLLAVCASLCVCLLFSSLRAHVWRGLPFQCKTENPTWAAGEKATSTPQTEARIARCSCVLFFHLEKSHIQVTGFCFHPQPNIGWVVFSFCRAVGFFHVWFCFSSSLKPHAVRCEVEKTIRG